MKPKLQPEIQWEVSDIVDEMGDLRAQMAPLLDRYSGLRDDLLKRGPGLYAGNRYDVRVSEYDAVYIGAEAVRLLLSADVLKLVEKVSPRKSVRVYARLLYRETTSISKGDLGND